jgi:hypothetical protein
MDVAHILFGSLSGLFALLTSIVAYVFKTTVKELKEKQIQFGLRLDDVEDYNNNKIETILKSIADIEKTIVGEIAKARYDSQDQIQKLQFNTELYYQRKDNCLVHGKEIAELKKEINEIKAILMKK